MKEKEIQFFISNVELLEAFLVYLWKNPVKIKEKVAYTGEGPFAMDFYIKDDEVIRMIFKTEWIAEELIIRVKYSLYDNQDYANPKSSLLLSFCYKCPQELGLCNQYGLYKKEDMKKLEKLNDINLIHKYQTEKNMLGNNQIFIFNMNKIKEHCSDKVLDQILQDFDKEIRDTFYSKS